MSSVCNLQLMSARSRQERWFDRSTRRWTPRPRLRVCLLEIRTGRQQKRSTSERELHVGLLLPISC